MINMIISLITTPIITRLVDPVAYGQLSVYNVYVNIGMFIFCLGMDQALVRFFYNKEDLSYRQSLLFRCWFLPAIALMLIGGLGFVFIIANWIQIDGDLTYFWFLFIGVVTQVLYRIALMVLRLQYKSKTYAFVNCLHKLSYIIIALLLICLIRSDHFVLLIVATIGSTLLSIAVSIIAERKLWMPNFSNENAISYKELLKFGAPFIVSLGVSAFYSAIDKLAIEYFCDYAEVGIYASAASIVSIFGIIQTAFNSLWAPMAIERYNIDPNDKEFHVQGYNYITVVMIFVGASLILVKDLIVFLLGESYRQAAFIIPFLTFYPILYTISETTVSGINFKKKSYWHLIIAVVCCLVNLLGNILLIPLYGAKGASIATGISYVLLFTLRTLIANFLFPVKYKIYKIYIVLLLLGGLALYNTFYTFTIISLGLYIITLLVLFLLYKKTIFDGFRYLKKTLQKKGESNEDICDSDILSK